MEFVSIGQIINGDDVPVTAAIQALNNVAANETGCSGDDNALRHEMSFNTGHGKDAPLLRQAVVETLVVCAVSRERSSSVASTTVFGLMLVVQTGSVIPSTHVFIHVVLDHQQFPH